MQAINFVLSQQQQEPDSDSCTYNSQCCLEGGTQVLLPLSLSPAHKHNKVGNFTTGLPKPNYKRSRQSRLSVGGRETFNLD